jgi:hypothetical protein
MFGVVFYMDVLGREIEFLKMNLILNHLLLFSLHYKRHIDINKKLVTSISIISHDYPKNAMKTISYSNWKVNNDKY